MPNPSNYDNQSDWMEYCVPIVMDENGGDNDQAVAQCISMWENKGLDVTQVNRAWSTLEIKSVDKSKREIEGVASTPSVDRIGDIVEPMGGKYSLPMPLLWQHNHDEPVGHVLSAKATKTGITVKAQLTQVDEPGRLKDLLDYAWQAVKAGLVRGLSIGFKPKEYSFIDDSPMGGIRFIEWDWYELSLVTIPANAEANINIVKSMDVGLQLPKPRPVVHLPAKRAVPLTKTPVKKLKHKYLTDSQIDVLRRLGAKNIQVHWSSQAYHNGEPLYLVSYSD
jgi:HK97 family phage prohead protease